MSTEFKLSATPRSELGKAASRRLRRLDKRIPAIVYGGESEPCSITLDGNEVSKSLKYESFYSQILTLDIDGQSEKVVLKAMHRHPAKSTVMHMDFLRISKKQAITMRTPLHFVGEDVCPGIKQGGGAASHLMTDVEIKCLPEYLPEFIEVDVSKLNIEQSLHLSDLKLPAHVEIPQLAQGSEHDLPVVSIHKLKAHKLDGPATDVAESKEASDSKDA